MEACPWQLHGIHGEKGPPLLDSWREPGAHDSQNWPIYPSGHVHSSIQLAGSPGAPRRAVCSEKSSKKPTPFESYKQKCMTSRLGGWRYFRYSEMPVYRGTAGNYRSTVFSVINGRRRSRRTRTPSHTHTANIRYFIWIDVSFLCTRMYSFTNTCRMD